MIRTIKGELTHKATDHVIVTVGGVGMRLFMPLTSLFAIGEVGSEVRLLVHTHVRDDAIELFGFATERERDMFELLISVSRIGPRLAKNILSGIEADQLAEFLKRGDVARLSMVPGVGAKTAERMIVELRDKLPRIEKEALLADVDEDVVSALVNLGYRRADAEKALRRAKEQCALEAALEELLRLALKHLSKT